MSAPCTSSTTSAITDFAAVTRAFLDDVRTAGGELRCNVTVTGFERRAAETHVRTRAGEAMAFDHVVVCAGLQSDRLAQAAGDSAEPRIVPFRGEYLAPEVPGGRARPRPVYPVPDPAFPFLGVHFTRHDRRNRRTWARTPCSPSARECYRRRDISWGDLADALNSPGLRRLVRRHWRMGWREWRGSLSRRAFAAGARSFVPELRAADLRPAPAGVRAQAIDADGSLVDDFRITPRDGVTAVRNAPSPAATSALAIAEHVVARSGLLEG